MYKNKNEFKVELLTHDLSEDFKQRTQLAVFYNCFVWPLSKMTWFLILLLTIIAIALAELPSALPFSSHQIYTVLAWGIGTILILHFLYHFKFGSQAIISCNKLLFPSYLVNKGMPKEIYFDSIRSVEVFRTHHTYFMRARNLWWRVHFNMDNGQVISIALLNFLSLPSLVFYLANNYQIPIKFTYPKEFKILWIVLCLSVCSIGYLIVLHEFPKLLEMR